LIKKKVVHIDDDIKVLLQNLRIEGNTVYIDQQLDRDTYVSLNKALEALGGKWNRSARGHIFSGNPSDKIAEALEAGEAVDIKKTYEFFETPVNVGVMLGGMLRIEPGMKVLEPSAGHGMIADIVRTICPDCTIHVIEIDPENRAVLKEKGYKLVGKDFLKYRRKKPLYDRIAMNPPFSRQQDIDHVKHAWKFLKPGGRLASVMAGGTEFRENRKNTDFLEWASQQPDFEILQLPEGSFKESGTGVNTIILTIQKPE
jgi:protein-L-isoaspartate O-methyltransferase